MSQFLQRGVPSQSPLSVTGMGCTPAEPGLDSAMPQASLVLFAHYFLFFLSSFVLGQRLCCLFSGFPAEGDAASPKPPFFPKAFRCVLTFILTLTPAGHSPVAWQCQHPHPALPWHTGTTASTKPSSLFFGTNPKQGMSSALSCSQEMDTGNEAKSRVSPTGTSLWSCPQGCQRCHCAAHALTCW